MNTSILVPIDFTHTSEIGLKTALFLARRINAKVHLIHVIEDDDIKMKLFKSKEEKEKGISEMISKAKLQLDSLEDEYEENSDIDIVTHTSIGELEEGISVFLEKNKMDFIVMGTEGDSDLSELLSGNNTFQVIRSSNLPVLAVKETLDITKCSKLLLMADDDGYDDKSIDMIKKFAHNFGSKILVAHILDKKDDINMIKASLRNLMSHHRLHEFQPFLIGKGQKYTCLNKLIEEEKIDYISAITSAREGIEKLFFGSETEELLEEISVPLLAIKEQVYNY